ncbi:SUMF1/EgtB/PvdO family nonheme iron enzyme [Planctomycetota bacterium]
MKKQFFGTIIGIISLTLPSWADETGFIQIKCAPGVQIFLDSDLQGVTNEDMGGLIIQNVKPGQHQIKAIKPGFQPQVSTITVNAGQVVSFEVKDFVPKVKITQKGDKREAEVKLKVGALRIQSLPIECTLSIAALNLNNQAKNKDEWLAEGVPVGKYKIVAEAIGKKLTHEVVVYEDKTAKIFFNFISGDIIDEDAHRRAEEQAAKQRQEQKLKAISAEARKLGIDFPTGWLFVPIKPGTFAMGSPAGEEGRVDDEKDHEVTLTKEFWIGAYEVTQQQYENVMGSNPSEFKGSNRPVDNASWDDAQEFIHKLNERERKAKRLPVKAQYRLPTEAEWEYVCRAGSQTAYCFGNDAGHLKNYAWFNENSGKQTHDVGKKRPNAWGLYDMHGNLCEWCSDWYSSNSYTSKPRVDPKGPTSGSSRVLRGGSWYYNPERCRSATRRGLPPKNRNLNYGFRVVLDLK